MFLLCFIWLLWSVQSFRRLCWFINSFWRLEHWHTAMVRITHDLFSPVYKLVNVFLVRVRYLNKPPTNSNTLLCITNVETTKHHPKNHPNTQHCQTFLKGNIIPPPQSWESTNLISIGLKIECFEKEEHKNMYCISWQHTHNSFRSMTKCTFKLLFLSNAIQIFREHHLSSFNIKQNKKKLSYWTISHVFVRNPTGPQLLPEGKPPDQPTWPLRSPAPQPNAAGKHYALLYGHTTN